MKVLVDMNLPPKLVNMLVENGIDSAHWFNIGTPDAKDTEIMEFARKNDYIIMSCDLDFSTILSATRDSKPSVVQIRIREPLSEQATKLISLALKQNESALSNGAILAIDTKKARTRLLPL